jgi:hypothetical protein
VGKPKPTDERFSPPSMLEYRDAVWPEGTDTDPAWHPRSFSRARRCYTKRDDGLVQVWKGRVWLNPPWSSPGPWLDRLLEHVTSRAHLLLELEGMFAVRNDPSTAWFKRAWAHADAVAFLGERTRYHQWDPRARQVVECGTPEFGSVIFYFGPRADTFVAEGRKRGHLVVPLRVHSRSGTVRAVKAKKKPPPATARLQAQVRATVGTFAREHPDLTLAELAAKLGDTAPVLQTLRVRDLWPSPAEASRRNGHANGRAREPAESTATQLRVQQVRAAIAELGKPEFHASEIMDALGVSRQTALRTLKRLPEVRMVGKLKSAKYQVIQ